jgi:histidinol-phosphate aminotransferase
VYRVRSYPNITVKLNQNESPFDLPEPVKRDLVSSFAEQPWNRYPTEFCPELTQELARHLGCSPDQLILGNGSNELVQFLGLALIEPGTRVVLLDPMFSLHRKVVLLHDGVPVPVPCEADFSTNADRVIDGVRGQDAVLVILTSPNNPTGKSIPAQDIARIARATDGFVVLDEAYHEFVDRPDGLDLLRDFPNVIVLRTFSKAAGLAGLRLGYLAAHPDVTAELLKARLPFMIDSLTQETARAVIRNYDWVRRHVAEMKAGTAMLFEALSAVEGVTVIPTSANFLVFSTGVPSGELVSECAARGVLIRDMSGYDRLEGFVRVNCGTEAENHAFLSALNDILFRGAGPSRQSRSEKPQKTLRSQSDLT